MADNNTSSLQIEVISVGIKEGASNLDLVTTAANNSDSKVKSLTGSIGALNGIFAAGLASTQAYAASLVGVADAATQRVGAVAAALGKQVSAVDQAAKSQVDIEKDKNDKIVSALEETNKKLLKKIQGQLETIDMMNYKARGKEMSEVQAHANKLNGLYDKVEKERKAGADAATNSILADIKKRQDAEEAALERQAKLNAQFNTATPGAQLKAARTAQAYADEGGKDPSGMFGSAAAAKATAAGIAELEGKVKAATHSAHQFTLANAGVTRELVTLGHEGLQGSWNRFLGSLMVLGNRTGTLPGMLQKLGEVGLGAALGMVAVTGAVIALAVAFVKGTMEANGLHKALILTGQYAGMTSSQLEDLAHSAESSSVSIGTASKAMLTLAESGRFTAKEIAIIGPAAAAMAAITGTSLDKIVESFVKLKEEPVKASIKLNEQYHYLTITIYDQIAALVKHGDKMGAAVVAEKAYADELKKRTNEVEAAQGTMERGWHRVMNAAASAWHQMTKALGESGNMGNASKLAGVNLEMKGLDEDKKNGSLYTKSDAFKKHYADLQRQQGEYTTAIEKERAKAADASALAQLQEEGLLAKERDKHDRDRVRSKADKRNDEKKKAIEDFNSENKAYLALQLSAQGKSVQMLLDKNANVEQIAKENGIKLTMTAADLAARNAAIDEHYKDPKGAKDDDRKQKLTDELDKIKLDFDTRKETYREGVTAIDKEEHRGVIGAYDAYTQRHALRLKEQQDETLRAAAEVARIEAFKTRNHTEIAEMQKRITMANGLAGKAIHKIGIEDEDDRKGANDKAVKRTESLLLDAGKARDAAEAIANYGKKATETAIQLETLQVIKEKLDPINQRGVIADRMGLAAQVDVATALKATNVLYDKISKDQQKQSASDLEGITTTEGAKVALYSATAMKLLEFDKAKADSAMFLARLNGTANEQMEADYTKLTAAYSESKATLNANSAINFKIAGLKDAAKEFETIGKNVAKLGPAFKGVSDAMKGFGDANKQLAVLTAKEQATGKEATEERMGAYGEMANAASNFFDKSSTGYKALQAVSEVYHAFEMGMALKDYITKVFFSTSVAEIKTAMAVEGMVVDDAVTANSVANSTVAAGASTVAGIAKAFEQMGVWGFVGAAAIIAFMAAIGVSSGGGGGAAPDLSADRQKKQGTGSVLGDDSAKSESLTKAMSDLQNSAQIGLEYSSGMLATLKSINDGIASMAASVSSTSGIRGTAADLLAVGVGSSKGAFGFSSDSTELQDSGLQFGDGQTVGGVARGGANVNSYQDIHKESSSWWGLSQDSSDNHQLGEVNQAFKDQVQLTVASLRDGILKGTKALGMDSYAIKDSIDSFAVNIGMISLKGLTGDQVQKELTAAFSKLGDDMTNSAFGYGLKSFQKVGEGMFQTLTRLASGVEVARVSLGNLGVNMIDYHNLADKQGDIGAELIKESIAAKEAGSNISGFISNLIGSASDIVTAYTKLLSIRDNLQSTGLRSDVTPGMINGAGGVDGLRSGLDAYIKLLPAEQQHAVQLDSMQRAFARIGVTMPTTAAGFTQLVQSLSASGQDDLAGRVLSLADSFDTMGQALKSINDKAVTDAHAKLQAAYDKEASLLQNTNKTFDGFLKSLNQFKTDLVTGENSPLTAYSKYFAIQQQYAETLVKAKAGDTASISNLTSIAQSFLSASKAYNASGNGYLADYSKVVADTQDMASFAAGQVDMATQQLDALNKQVDGLLSIDTSVQKVETAINVLTAALMLQAAGSGSVTDAYGNSVQNNTAQFLALMTGQYGAYSSALNGGQKDSAAITDGSAVTVLNGSHASGLGYVPFDGYVAQLHKGEAVLTASENKAYQMDYSKYGSSDALVSEIKALRNEVSQLRQQQSDETTQMIMANFNANEQAANLVVSGVHESVSTTARREAIKPVLN